MRKKARDEEFIVQARLKARVFKDEFYPYYFAEIILPRPIQGTGLTPEEAKKRLMEKVKKLDNAK